MHVSILVPLGHTSLVNIEGTHQILSSVNESLDAMGRKPLFDLHLVGLSRKTMQTTGLFTVNPDLLIQDVPRTDLIIIPAIHGDPQTAIRENSAFIPWIIEQHKGGAEVASLCVGAFFLAATGLLKGRQCATHWGFAAEFRKMFPDVRLVDEKIITEEEGIYTSGGAYSYLNLLLHLIQKHAGRDIAVLTSKLFLIDIDKSSQSPFIVFRGQKAHEDEQVRRAQEFIEGHYREKIRIDELASTFALSRRNLERRFRKATCNTIAEYAHRVKIEAAKASLETSRMTVYEVMYEVGYSDLKAFRAIFKRITGLSPNEYRIKYSRAASLISVHG